MDKCKNIDFGSYKHCIKIRLPKYYSKEAHKLKPYIYVDKCILPEIKYLWSRRIKTSGCCCGHKKIKAYVCVWEESIQQMLNLEYIQDKNKDYVFYLKFIKE